MPVVLFWRAAYPLATFSHPLVLADSAKEPTAVF